MIGYGNSYFISTILDAGVGNPPVNTVAPVISGSNTLGSVLSSTTGTWTGDATITYTYQWYRGINAIGGATNSTYTLVVADSSQSITCQVTATNPVGSSSATSNTITAQTFTAPINTHAPSLSGTAQEGQILTCSTGTWTGNPTPTYTYQWKRNGSNIGSATNSTYTLVTADVGQSIKCTVTGTNGVGSSTADSNTVIPIAAFTGLLDTYPSASVAYSLRRLRSTYTGNLIRVRRSNDNAEQDIGYNSNNDLDTVSLLAFCGINSAFITTWYDQSGNANNSTQSTAANQARIVLNGVITTDPISGKTSSQWSNSSYALSSSITMTQTHFRLGVFNRTASGTRIYGVGTNASTPKIGGWDASNSIASAYGTGTATHSASNTSTGKLMMTVLRDSSNNVKCWLNNTALTTGTSSGTSNPITYFGAFSTVTSVGYKQEEIYWASNQESNRIGIETNANTYWTIY